MSQKRAKVVTVTDSEGLRGTIDTASPTLNKRDRQALVHMEDGQQLLVPIDELQKQEDGSFTLPFSLRQLASDPQSVLAGRGRERADVGGGGVRADARLTGDGEEETLVVPVVAETLQVEK